MKPGRATKRVRSSRASMLTAFTASHPSTHSVRNTWMSAIWGRESQTMSNERNCCALAQTAPHRLHAVWSPTKLPSARWPRAKPTSNQPLDERRQPSRLRLMHLPHHLDQGAQRATARTRTQVPITLYRGTLLVRLPRMCQPKRAQSDGGVGIAANAMWYPTANREKDSFLTTIFPTLDW